MTYYPDAERTKNRNVANGYIGADANTRVPFAQAPAWPYVSVAVDTVLTTANMVVEVTAAGKQMTLPAATAVRPIIVKNTSAGDITVIRAGADTIYDTASVTTVTVVAGAARSFYPDGTSKWVIA